MRSVMRDAWDLGRYVFATGIVTLGLAAGPVAIILGYVAVTVAAYSFELVAGVFKGGTLEDLVGGLLGLLQFCGVGAFTIGFVVMTIFLFTVLLILPASMLVEISVRGFHPLPVAVKLMAFLMMGFLVGSAAAAVMVGLHVFSNLGATPSAWAVTVALPVLCIGATFVFGFLLVTMELAGDAFASLWNLALRAWSRTGSVLPTALDWTRFVLGWSRWSRVSTREQV